MEIKDRIIGETSRLLGLKSCRLITMDEIASNLGISKRTIYEQFADKSTLLEECFNYHLDLVAKDISVIEQESDNSLISVMRIIKLASESIQNVNYDHTKDLEKYYPKIYERTFKQHIKFQRTLRNKLLQKALKDGLILKDAKLNLLNSLIHLNLFYCSNNDFIKIDSIYSSAEIATMSIFIILRGVSTLKGIETIDNYKDILFKK